MQLLQPSTLVELRFDSPSIRKAAAAHARECCALCGATEYCTAFTWAAAGGGTCWLKQWSGVGVARDGYVSAHSPAPTSSSPLSLTDLFPPHTSP